jgi:hypothetical protein
MSRNLSPTSETETDQISNNQLQLRKKMVRKTSIELAVALMLKGMAYMLLLVVQCSLQHGNRTLINLTFGKRAHIG